MFEELTKLANATPFVPFTIEMSSGRQVLVRSREHIMLPKKGALVVVEDDEGLVEFLPLRHITALSGREQETL